MSLWSKIYYELIKFSSNSISNTRKKEIIDMLSSAENANDYNIQYMLQTISPYIDDQSFFDIGINIIKNRTNTVTDYYLCQMVERCCKVDKQTVKAELLKSKSSALNRMLLLAEPNLEEEIKGLRGCASIKYLPSQILDKYKMEPKAIAKLPTIMRLNVLYAFSMSTLGCNNIFENLSKDELEKLLFPSMIRYPEKISEILDKYEEIQYKGQDSSVRVSGKCDKCGPYDIVINTKIIRAESSLRQTYIGKTLLNDTYCPFCYTKMMQTQTFESLN